MTPADLDDLQTRGDTSASVLMLAAERLHEQRHEIAAGGVAFLQSDPALAYIALAFVAALAELGDVTTDIARGINRARAERN